MSGGFAKAAPDLVSDEEGICSRAIPERPCSAVDRMIWGSSSPSSFTSCVTLGKSLPVSEPQFPCLSHGDNSSSTAQGWSVVMTLVTAKASEGPSHVPGSVLRSLHLLTHLILNDPER